MINFYWKKKEMWRTIDRMVNDPGSKCIHRTNYRYSSRIRDEFLNNRTSFEENSKNEANNGNEEKFETNFIDNLEYYIGDDGEALVQETLNLVQINKKCPDFDKLDKLCEQHEILERLIEQTVSNEHFTTSVEIVQFIKQFKRSANFYFYNLAVYENQRNAFKETICTRLIGSFLISEKESLKKLVVDTINDLKEIEKNLSIKG